MFPVIPRLQVFQGPLGGISCTDRTDLFTVRLVFTDKSFQRLSEALFQSDRSEENAAPLIRGHRAYIHFSRLCHPLR
jgi:hypothetical protein